MKTDGRREKKGFKGLIGGGDFLRIGSNQVEPLQFLSTSSLTQSKGARNPTERGWTRIDYLLLP
jgi:hypothetical protein